jgi:hypothetical protein
MRFFAKKRRRGKDPASFARAFGPTGHDGVDFAVTMAWISRSRWRGFRGHDAVDFAVTMGRSAQRRA